MSFLVKGIQGPTNIPEGGVPRDKRVTSFSPGMFQAIARAGLEAAGEGSFERTKRRGSKNRMAGQTDSLRRSIERGLQSGGGEEFLPKPQANTTMPREKAIPSKPTRMTKEEYDKMPKRKFEFAPGMEDLFDRFPTQGFKNKTRRGSKTRDEMRDPNATSTVYNRKKRRSRDEMRDPNAKGTVRSKNIL